MEPLHGVVLLHEAFGATPHMHHVAQQYQGHGFRTAVPAFFPLAGGPASLPQNAQGLAEGRTYIDALSLPTIRQEIARQRDALQAQGCTHIHAVGYCWGGSLAYDVASQMEGFSKAVGYYGGKIKDWATAAAPHIPFLAHLADADQYLDVPGTTAALQARQCPVFRYAADHGFNRHDGQTYEPTSATLAFQRTLSFLQNT